MNRQKPEWLDALNRLDMAAKIYRIARCIWEVAAWLEDKLSPPGS
ncbi:MAG: hypothetical protein E6559_00400 [Pantoea sp.]|nr:MULTISPECIES: hypothetical protein [Pantoea]MDU5836274.1 hypothetical protein [Pantoea sp.]MDU6438370.1 hypothetical protein [Pantoea sp.]